MKTTWLRWLVTLFISLALAGCPGSESEDGRIYRPDRSAAIRQQYVDREQAVEDSMEGRMAYQVTSRQEAMAQALAKMSPEQRRQQTETMANIFRNAEQQPLFAASMLNALPDGIEIDQATLITARETLEEQLKVVRARLDALPEGAPVTVKLVQDLSLLTVLSLSLDEEQYALDSERGIVGLMDVLDSTGRFGDLRGGLTRSFAVNDALCQAAYEAALHGDDRLRNHAYFAFAPYWFMHRFQPDGEPLITHDGPHDEPRMIKQMTHGALSHLASLYPSPEIQWWFENYGQEQAGQSLSNAVESFIGTEALPEDFAPPPYGLYPHAGVLFWRSNWSPNADALFARGAVDDDPDSRLDAGQVSWTAHGDPVLIQAQTDFEAAPVLLPHESPVEMNPPKWLIPAHNVLRVGDALPKRGRAPIITRELNANGGNLRIDATELYAELSQWHRDLFWEAEGELRIIDNVRYGFGHRDRTKIFWHLSAREPVKLTQDRSRTIVEWGDSAIVIQGNSPMEIQQFLVPDNEAAGSSHVVLAMRTIGRPPSLRVLTRVLPREADATPASDVSEE